MSFGGNRVILVVRRSTVTADIALAKLMLEQTDLHCNGHEKRKRPTLR